MASWGKTVRKIRKEAQEAGWDERQARGGHVVLYPTDGSRPITLPGSPSDARGMRTLEVQLRRAGLDIDIV